MRSKKAGSILGPSGYVPGWRIPDDALPISSENIHTNYAEIPTTVEFRASENLLITLFFPADGGCFVFGLRDGHYLRTPQEIKKLGIDVRVVPILGPLEHREAKVSEETVRKNLLTTRASRNFRNYWLHNPEGFDEFSELVSLTWPGMEVGRPEEIDDIVAMFCKENRKDRELYWSGFGFQIWLQLLTHVVRSPSSSILIVDEPELYLHPDVQRQLLSILRDIGPDIILATHSTEIMSEADPSEILLIDKKKKTAERIKDVEGVQSALDSVGSIQNITLTRLAQNRRILFTEGETDFRLIRRFARVMGYEQIASGTAFTTLESGGFSGWQRVRSLAASFQDAFGFDLKVAAIFDRDYWCDEEVAHVEGELGKHISHWHIHKCKEIENYLLVPTVIERALGSAVREKDTRNGTETSIEWSAEQIFRDVTEPLENGLRSQFIAKRQEFFRSTPKNLATLAEEASELFNEKWQNIDTRYTVVPGKRVIASMRAAITDKYSVSLTDHRLVTSFQKTEFPAEMYELLDKLEAFRTS
ncbi:ATP-dependent nuclease [Devosia salina]